MTLKLEKALDKWDKKLKKMLPKCPICGGIVWVMAKSIDEQLICECENCGELKKIRIEDIPKEVIEYFKVG